MVVNPESSQHPRVRNKPLPARVLVTRKLEQQQASVWGKKEGKITEQRALHKKNTHQGHVEESVQ